VFVVMPEYVLGSPVATNDIEQTAAALNGADRRNVRTQAVEHRRRPVLVAPRCVDGEKRRAFAGELVLNGVGDPCLERSCVAPQWICRIRKSECETEVRLTVRRWRQPI
jgi:hypothetical protein